MRNRRPRTHPSTLLFLHNTETLRSAPPFSSTTTLRITVMVNRSRLGKRGGQLKSDLQTTAQFTVHNKLQILIMVKETFEEEEEREERRKESRKERSELHTEASHCPQQAPFRSLGQPWTTRVWRQSLRSQDVDSVTASQPNLSFHSSC